MGHHWIGKTLREMLDSNDTHRGILYDISGEELQNAWWLASEVARENLWSVEDLLGHVWDESSLKTLPTGYSKDKKQKVGCVRNITYAGCKAEASRLFNKVDAFDYLWGRYKPTAEYQAYLDANDGKGAGFTGTRFD